jgi:hypothetical protein
MERAVMGGSEPLQIVQQFIPQLSRVSYIIIYGYALPEV